MEFIALLSSGKGTWAQVSGLIKYGEWEKIILLGDDFSKQFTTEKPFEFIRIDLNKKLKDLKDEFSEKLKGKINGTEVALSIASGDGKLSTRSCKNGFYILELHGNPYERGFAHGMLLKEQIEKIDIVGYYGGFLESLFEGSDIIDTIPCFLRKP